MNWPAILLTVAGVAGALVTAAVAGVVVLLVRTERLVKSAVPRLAILPCPACGAPIGQSAAAAVEAARKEEALRRWEEAKQKGVVLRRRVDPYWRLSCATCGAALKFDPGASRGPLTKV